MSNFKADLSIKTGKGDALSVSKSGTYHDVISKTSTVDNSDAFITLLKGGDSLAENTILDCKSLVIRNTGLVGAEIQLQLEGWTAGTPDTNAHASNLVYLNYLLGSGEYLYFPNFRQVNYSTDTSACSGATVTNTAPADVNSGNLYVDTGVNLGAKIEDSATSITVEDIGPFEVGDLIQVGINTTTATRIEIMRVTAKGAEDGESTLTVDRALYGTSLADGDSQTDSTNGAVDEANVYFPFFNTTNDYNAHITGGTDVYLGGLQTDSAGILKINNLCGYGRTADNVASGLVAGSFSGRFYNPAFLEFGLSGITASTETGLTASTAYAFDVIFDEAVAKDSTANEITIAFTTDSSNTKFGGKNGVLQKIQAQFDANLYNASSKMFGKKCTIGIVAGDIRITSGSRLSTSRVGVSVASSGTTMFGVGRMPAVSSNEILCEGTTVGSSTNQVTYGESAKLPDETVFDVKTGVSTPNVGGMFYDTGNGQIKGTASGTLDYRTGALNIVGPPNANFVFSVNHGSALAGGNQFSGTTGNSIVEIAGRSVNQKINTTIEILGVQ